MELVWSALGHALLIHRIHKISQLVPTQARLASPPQDDYHHQSNYRSMAYPYTPQFLGLDVLVIEDLLEKKRIRPLAVRSRDPYSHWLLYREQDTHRATVKAFTQWIRDEAALSLQTLSNCRSLV
jgi:hypothetical protein